GRRESTPASSRKYPAGLSAAPANQTAPDRRRAAPGRQIPIAGEGELASQASRAATALEARAGRLARGSAKTGAGRRRQTPKPPAASAGPAARGATAVGETAGGRPSAANRSDAPTRASPPPGRL